MHLSHFTQLREEVMGGELVLVFDGMKEMENNTSCQSEAENMLREGLSVKDIVNELQNTAPKNDLKKFLMSRKK